MVWLYAGQACGGQLRVAPPGGQVRAEDHLCTTIASVKALRGCCREGTVESALVLGILRQFHQPNMLTLDSGARGLCALLCCATQPSGVHGLYVLACIMPAHRLTAATKCSVSPA